MTEEQKSTEQLIDELERTKHPLSSSYVQEAFQTTPDKGGSSTVTLAVIIAAAVIACTAITIVILQNPPW